MVIANDKLLFVLHVPKTCNIYVSIPLYALGYCVTLLPSSVFVALRVISACFDFLSDIINL